MFGWLVVFYAMPGGIAAPYAAQPGGGPLAAGPGAGISGGERDDSGSAVHPVARPRPRAALMGPLAMLACGTLALTALHPGLAVSLVIFSPSAAFGVYQIAASTAFVVKVPQDRRGQATGIANAGVAVGQDNLLAAGAAAQVAAPAVVSATGGAIGAAVALVMTLRWRQVPPPQQACGQAAPRPCQGWQASAAAPLTCGCLAKGSL